MSLPELKLRGREGSLTEPASARLSARAWCRRLAGLWWLSAAVIAAAAALATLAPPASAQRTRPQGTPALPSTPYAPCPPEMQTGQPFVTVPEIAAGQDGVLRGTVMLGSEKRWMATRLPFNPNDWAPANNSQSQCNTPYVRYFMGLNTVQFVMNEMGTVVSVPYPTPTPTAGNIPLPMPGPTLRARVGNLVQLAFYNLINAQDFGDSIDNAEKGRGGGCDETSAGYPGLDRQFFPDCFHGSSTGNIHFHGTHTNPNTTGDNVFIEVRPALRDKGKLTDDPVAKTEKAFAEFFTRCERTLNLGFGGGASLREWPTSWNDMPKGWTDYQEDQLKKYDRQLREAYPKAGLKSLWEVDREQLRQNAWPQYYIGAYPYCFRLPEYTAATYPPATPTPAPTRAGGAGTAELGHAGMGMGGGQVAADPGPGSQLQMGQAPGTHWYHAHKHGSTAINVANGMTGAFIIEGQYDKELNDFYGYGTQWTRVQPLMVINQLGQTPNLMTGGPGTGPDKGPDFSVNGRLRPYLTMTAGEVQMFRIVNTSGRAAIYFENPPAGFQWKQLAQDGVQFSENNYQNRKFQNVVVASGNRVDLLIKAPAQPCAQPDADGTCSYPVTVKNIVDMTDLQSAKIRPLTLFTIKVKPDTNGLAAKYPNRTRFIPRAPSFPKFLKSISDDEIKGTKTMVFASKNSAGPTMHMIDDKRFDGEVGVVALLNTAEEWKVVNQSYPSTAVVSHPFHIHINPFQITEVFDPNAPPIDPRTGRVPIDPATKKPYIDKHTNQTAVKYVFWKDNLLTGQCYLDPADPASWKPMTWVPARGAGRPAHCVPTPMPFDADNIWWDVFPIPSGYEATKATTDPKTGKVTKTPITYKDKDGKDVPIQVPGYFKMRSRFVDFPGFYVLHCHILAHEDRGMMTIVEVAPTRTPYSHH